MKTLNDYSKLIDQNKTNPGALCVLQNEIASDYGFCAELITKIKQAKSAQWPMIKFEKEKPKSDKHTDCEWGMTKEGQDEIMLTFRMKALEKYMSAIKSYCFVAGQEAHNQF